MLQNTAIKYKCDYDGNTKVGLVLKIHVFRFGKPCILDISGTEQDKILCLAEEKYNAIYPECWNDLMDQSIMADEE